MGSPSNASCQIIGNLSREPDFRRTASGNPICDLSVAVSKKIGNGQEKTSFFEVVVWGKTAENCRQYLSKGSGVFIVGELEQDRWQDKHTQENRSKVRVTAEKVLFLNNNRKDRQQNQEQLHGYEPTEQGITGVDPQYAPEPPKARFYGDPGVRTQPAAMTAGENPVQDDIPF